MSVVVRTATRRDAGTVGSALADAFLGDPVYMWILAGEGYHLRRMTRLFAAEAQHQMIPLNSTDIVEINGEVGGAAMWAPPGQWQTSWWTTLRMVPGFLAGLGSGITTGLKVDAALTAAHPEEPHWYLSAIGTTRIARGTGCGTALLASRLERIDAEHAPAYLESSKRENVPYYERFGFEVTGEIVVPHGGPTLWAMWRPAR